MAQSERGPANKLLPDLSDTDLVQRLQAGDEEALREMYRRFGRLIYSVAYRVVGDHALAEEIMQDAFLRCWNRSDSFRPSAGRVAPWLAAIARNRAIDVIRGRQHQARLRERAPLLPTRDLASADHSDLVVSRQTISEAVSQLPEPQRVVVELAYFGGLSQVEIADQLGEPLGTVKSRTRAAMERLRNQLRPSFEALDGKADAHG